MVELASQRRGRVEGATNGVALGSRGMRWFGLFHVKPSCSKRVLQPYQRGLTPGERSPTVIGGVRTDGGPRAPFCDTRISSNVPDGAQKGHLPRLLPQGYPQGTGVADPAQLREPQACRSMLVRSTRDETGGRVLTTMWEVALRSGGDPRLSAEVRTRTSHSGPGTSGLSPRCELATVQWWAGRGPLLRRGSPVPAVSRQNCPQSYPQAPVPHARMVESCTIGTSPRQRFT